MSRFCLHRFRKQNCKARDPISRRTVTFGETAHKKVHPMPHLWVAATPSVLQRMARLLRKFLADRLQALSQTNVFLFLYATRRAYSGPFFMLTRRLAPAGTGTSAASPARSAKHFATAATVGAAARRPLGLQGLRLWAGIPRAPRRRAHNQLCG